MRLNFSPNTPRTRKKLIPGEFYLTIYNNAASICISVYRGDDVWQNPFKNYQTATNKVAFFAPTSVFKIPSFKGWEGVSVPEPEDERTPKRWESASFYLLMLKKDGILRLYTPAGSELHTFYPTSPYKNPTEWLEYIKRYKVRNNCPRLPVAIAVPTKDLLDLINNFKQVSNSNSHRRKHLISLLTMGHPTNYFAHKK